MIDTQKIGRLLAPLEELPQGAYALYMKGKIKVPNYVPLKSECSKCRYIYNIEGNEYYKCYVQGECPAFNDPSSLIAAIIDREVLDNVIIEREKERIIELSKELITLITKKDSTDDGREFYPTTIHSCRCMDSARIGEIIPELEKLLK